LQANKLGYSISILIQINAVGYKPLIMYIHLLLQGLWGLRKRFVTKTLQLWFEVRNRTKLQFPLIFPFLNCNNYIIYVTTKHHKFSICVKYHSSEKTAGCYLHDQSSITKQTLLATWQLMYIHLDVCIQCDHLQIEFHLHPVKNFYV